MVPYINIFNKTIPVYGLCFFIGIFVAVSVAWLISKRKDIMGYDVVYSAVFTSVGAIIGSKLLFILVSFKQIIELGIPWINVLRGGFVFYGGLIGGIIGLYIYLKVYKLDIWEYFDLYATVLPLGHSIGRIGCFFGGCCYGMEYDGPLHCVYDYNIGNTPVGVPLLPIQLIESFLLFCLFILLLCMFYKGKQKGNQVIVYAFAYSVMRFVLEFFRGDKERGFLLNLSTSQIISIVMFFSVLIAVFIRKQKYKN